MGIILALVARWFLTRGSAVLMRAVPDEGKELMSLAFWRAIWFREEKNWAWTGLTLRKMPMLGWMIVKR